MTGKWALAENLRESQGITGDSRGTARDNPGNTHGNVRESIEKRGFWRPLASDCVMVDR
jgi:hypothetical protein